MARFEYKCRRCGGISDNLFCSEGIARNEIINAKLGLNSKLEMAPDLLGVHLCSDGGQGISDLQGFRNTDKPIPPKAKNSLSATALIGVKMVLSSKGSLVAKYVKAKEIIEEYERKVKNK